MSDAGRPERRRESTEDKDDAERIGMNQENLNRSTSDAHRSHDGCDVGLESTEPIDESEFGFAPRSIELRGKLDGDISELSGKRMFGFAPEMVVVTKRDKPPTLAPPECG